MADETITLDALKEKIAEVKTDVDALELASGSIDDVNNLIDSLETDLESFSTQSDQALEMITQAKDELDAQVTSFTAGLEAAAKERDEAESKVAGLESQVTGLTSDVKTATDEAADLQSQVDSLKSQLASAGVAPASKPDATVHEDFQEIKRIIAKTKGADHPLVAKLDGYILTISEAIVG